MSGNIKLTRNQIEEKLKEQIQLLQLAAENYDKGVEIAAQNMATALRVLVHDTPKSMSILSIYKIKSNTPFFNTAFPYSPTNLLTHNGLVGMKFESEEDGSKGVYMPHFGGLPENRYCGFNAWWEDDIVIKDKKARTFSRKDLVLYVANKDGGAHVDEKIKEEYSDLKYNNSIGWMMKDNSGERSLDNSVIYASIREIAYEVLKSLYKRDSKLFKREYF